MPPLDRKGYTFDNALEKTQDQYEKLQEAHGEIAGFLNKMYDVFDSTRNSIQMSDDIAPEDVNEWVSRLNKLESQMNAGMQLLSFAELREDFGYLYGDIQQWFED